MTAEVIQRILPALRESDVERVMRVEAAREGAWWYFMDWEALAEEGAARDEVSDRVNWTRRWSPEFNLLGVAGERLFSELTGLERGARFGDGGEDFPGVDVKATSHWESPRLLRLEGDPLRAAYFALIGVDVLNQRARYVGYATRGELARAPLSEYGYGPTRTLLANELHPELPPLG